MINLSRQEIEALVDLPTMAMAMAIEDAYKAASNGKVNLPPVGHITFPEISADCHMEGDDNFVIKIATGFPENSNLNLPTGNGLVLVLSAKNRSGSCTVKR